MYYTVTCFLMNDNTSIMITGIDIVTAIAIKIFRVDNSYYHILTNTSVIFIVINITVIISAMYYRCYDYSY